MKHLNLLNRLLVGITLLFILGFGASCALLYYTQKPILLERSELEVQNHLKTLELLLSIHFKDRQENVKTALKIANNLLYEQSSINITDTLINVEITNQKTLEKSKVQVPLWYYKNKPLHYDYSFVDEIQFLTKNTVTIFQKIPEGYLRISTNVRNQKGERGINTFISNESPVARNIDKGLRYTGRAFVVDDWYVTQYEPIIIQGEVVGMLYAGIKENNLNNLRKAVYSQKYLQTGIAWCLNREGKFLVHPKKEGTEIINKRAWEYMQIEQNGKLRFEDTETGETKWIYFVYNPVYNMYLGIEISEKALVNDSINAVLEKMIFASGGIFLLIFIIAYIRIAANLRPLKNIRNRLQSLAKGEIPETIKTKRQDEVGQMIYSLNTLIHTFISYTKFAEEVSENKLETDFSSLSDKDVLGNSLKKMQFNLKQVAEESNKIQWSIQALNKFNDLIQKFNHSEEELTREFLKSFIKYFNGQAGIIYLNELHQAEGELKKIAYFAEDKDYSQKEEINITEGLVGQSFRERKMKVLSNIPENYFQIQTGIAKIPPKTLCLFPIFSENESLGVVEIASLYDLEAYQIETAEKIVNNLAFSIYKLRLLQNTI